MRNDSLAIGLICATVGFITGGAVVGLWASFRNKSRRLAGEPVTPKSPLVLAQNAEHPSVAEIRVKSSNFDLIKKVSARLFKALCVWLLVATVFIAIGYIFFQRVPVLLVAFSCGVLGGFIGLQRRLKEINLEDLMLLEESKYYTFLSPLVSGFLAVVLYAIFISGLVKGDLFPSFLMDKADYANPSSPVFVDIFAIHAKTVEDYSKLMVWSFVAGFYERFVTDILGRFQNATNSEGK